MKDILTPRHKKKAIVFLSVSAGGLATFFTIFNGFFESMNLLSAAPPNISGTWLIENEIEYSDKRSYVGAKAEFKLFLQQDGRTVYGDGEKISVNNQNLPYIQRVRIEVEGKVYEDSVRLNFKEFGLNRVTVGSFKWAISRDKLSGTFTSTAASTQGKSFGSKLAD